MNLVAKLNQFYDELAHEHRNPMLIETSRAMMQGYLNRWEREDADVRVRGIEVPFSLELPVPEDLPDWARPDKPRYVGGIIDSLIEVDGVLMATDMKTTKWANSAYWKELDSNPQLTQYSYALYAAGYDRVSFLWDVITKPSIEPKKLTKAAISDIESGVYCGWPVPSDVPEDGQESPELYQRRLFNWYVENPQKYERRAFDRNEAQLLRYVYSEHYMHSEMELCKDRGVIPSYSPRNFNACYSYGRLCEYSDLCTNVDSEMLGYTPRQKREGAPELGVTPSQSKCFLTCRQQWLYRYQQKIERTVKLESDALDLGSACHGGREVILAARLEDPIVLPLELGGPVQTN